MKAGRSQRLGRARPAHLGATAARRRVAVRLSWRVRQRAGRSEGSVHAQGGGASAARHCEAAARQQGSELAAAAQRAHARHAQVPARAEQRGEGQRGRERKEREREWRERKESQRFDSVKTQDFQLKLKKF